MVSPENVDEVGFDDFTSVSLGKGHVITVAVPCPDVTVRPSGDRAVPVAWSMIEPASTSA
jgi:hypothetical protein